MSITPFQARLALAGFLFAGSATAINLLYLQDQALVSQVARSKIERAKQRAESDRARRLALAPKEAPPPPLQTVEVLAPAAMAAANAVTVGGARAGRFSPSAGTLEPADMVATDTELRMPEIARLVQGHLARRGYEPGSTDGVVGVVTRAAIMAYEHDQGLPLTAEPSEALLHHLSGARPGRPAAYRGRPTRSPGAEQIIRLVQQSLSQLGYFSGKIDGLSGEETVRAVREYEMDVGMVPSGRISGPLVTRLARSTSAAKPIPR